MQQGYPEKISQAVKTEMAALYAVNFIEWTEKSIEEH